ncbi:MAG: hypothetical protein R2828_12145 [Saprospiraceae bacterium]
MKKLILAVFTLLLFNGFAQAQEVPQAFKYQAVVRDADGQLIPDQQVGIFIELVGTDTIYSETHTATTNSFGLVNLEVGRGTPVFGTFAEIDWNQQVNIVISLDVTGGTNYEFMGFSELLSVPFALHAANAGSGDDMDKDPTNELQDWSNLPGIPADIADGDQVDDADADPVNEIQVLSQDGANVTLSKDGGTISINDADADPANELEMPTDAQAGDIVYYDGTSWKKVPTGGSGQVLTLGADGLPYWGGLISITLPNGDIVYFSPVDNFGGTGADQVQWGPLEDITAIPNLSKPEALMDYNGESNTAAIVAQLGDYTPPNSNLSYGAKLCDDLVAFGYDDWYLPAAGELHYAATQTELSFGDSNGYLTSTENTATVMWYFFQGTGVGGGTFPPDIYNSRNKRWNGASPDFPVKCRCARRN